MDKRHEEKNAVGRLRQRDEFILSLAREAYQEKPFYRWFYDNASVDVEHADVRRLPFITKKDFFHYEEETGQPYYLPLGYPDSSLEYLRTSGTTCQPLVIPWLKSEWSFLYNSLLLNFIEQIKGRPRFLNAVNPNQLEEMRAFQSVLVNVPHDRMADAPYVLDLIARHRPNIFLDNSPGLWFNYLLDHGLDPCRAGIQMVCAYPSAELAQKVESLGLKYVSAFGCMEAGFFGYAHAGLGEVYHLSDAEPIRSASDSPTLLGGIRLQVFSRLFPCDCYQGMDLQAMFGRRDIRVRRVDGELSTAGAGELVITCANSAFPFIKYLNSDRVEIHPEAKCDCGFVGQSMRFECRDHNVQIPYLGGGMNVSLEGIALGLKGFRRVFPIHIAPDPTVRIVVTLVEDELATAACLDLDLAERIMTAATGINSETMRLISSRRNFLPFFPAVRIPVGTIPLRDQHSLKSRLYLDAVSGYVPDEYRPVLALIDQLVDRAAIIRSGSWFLPVEVSQPTPA